MLKKTHTHTVSLSHTHSVKLYLKSFIDLPSVKLISFSSLINADRYPLSAPSIATDRPISCFRWWWEHDGRCEAQSKCHVDQWADITWAQVRRLHSVRITSHDHVITAPSHDLSLTLHNEGRAALWPMLRQMLHSDVREGSECFPRASTRPRFHDDLTVRCYELWDRIISQRAPQCPLAWRKL